MGGISWLKLIIYAGVLITGVILGNWFLVEAKKAHRRKLPWYKPYFSVPGLIILVAMCLILIYFLIL